jgi:hypothetical protein
MLTFAANSKDDDNKLKKQQTSEGSHFPSTRRAKSINQNNSSVMD